MASRKQQDNRPTGVTETELLQSVYDIISWSFDYPESVSESSFKSETSNLLPRVARRIDRPAADQLARFVDEYEEISTEQYVDTLELEPACPLYLGDYVFDEPSTCRDIADADRNQYMVELAGIYEHYGLVIEDELPDFVPAMAEFLSMTLDHRGDALRQDFLERVVEYLPKMIRHFEDHGTPFQYPLSALYRIAIVDLGGDPDGYNVENGGDR